jgi:alpha-D-ribose 1-methylphosphonate 5-triphosphate diphosphatase
MRAIDAIRAGVASCLCSDYQPSTLIAAAFAVAAQTDLTWPQAIALVTANPADACGLTDRGRIAVGQRADLVAVAQVGGLPLVSHTWSGGRLVFSTHYLPARTPAVAIREPQRVAA